MDIMILGAGGVGGYLGALLACAGHAVIFVDRWQEHVDAINHNGLKVTGQESFTVRAPATTHPTPASVASIDLLILATKNIDTTEALAVVADIDIRCVTSIQNGLDLYGPLIAAFGAERVIGMVTLISGSLIAPGQVRGFVSDHPTFIGELNGRSSDRVETLRAAFGPAGLPLVIPDDITAVRWSKMIWWIPLVILPTLTRLTLGEVYIHRDAAYLFTYIERECAAVATRLGHPPRDYPMIQIARRLALPFDEAVEDVLAMGQKFIAEGTGHYEVAMLLDIMNHRLTEVDNTAGVIVREAQRIGLAVPYTEFAWRAIRTIESAFNQTNAKEACS